MSNLPSERRKRLKAEYKDRPREMGVYLIRNRMTGRLLLGCNRDLRARFNRHRMNLKYGSDECVLLQADWRTYGADAFEFEIAELLEPMDDPGYDPSEDLTTLKQLWLEKLSANPEQQFY